MININEELYNKVRVRSFVKKVDDIFLDQGFTNSMELFDRFLNKRFNLLFFKQRIYSLFDEEIDVEDKFILEKYFDDYDDINKRFGKFQNYDKVGACRYAMKKKDEILKFVEELALKYGGLE